MLVSAFVMGATAKRIGAFADAVVIGSALVQTMFDAPADQVANAGGAWLGEAAKQWMPDGGRVVLNLLGRDSASFTACQAGTITAKENGMR